MWAINSLSYQDRPAWCTPAETQRKIKHYPVALLSICTIYSFSHHATLLACYTNASPLCAIDSLSYQDRSLYQRYTSVPLSVCQCQYVIVSESLSICQCAVVSVSMSVCHCQYISVPLSVSVYQCAVVSVSMPVCHCQYVSVSLSVCQCAIATLLAWYTNGSPLWAIDSLSYQDRPVMMHSCRNPEKNKTLPGSLAVYMYNLFIFASCNPPGMLH